MQQIYLSYMLVTFSPRHAEYLEQIQQKAWELSLQKCTSDQGVPVIKPYTVAKKCEVISLPCACSMLIVFLFASTITWFFPI